MALSLAACGGSSTPVADASGDAAADPAVVAVSSNFTTSIDSLTGTTAADTFTGDAATVSGADSVSGGAGTDTLKVYGITSSSLPTMSGIENLEVYNIANAGSFDLTSAAFADVTKLTLDNTTANASNTITLEADDTLALKTVTGSADVNIATAATITTTSVEVNGGVGASTDLMELDFNGTGLTSISLATTGANYVDIDSAGATSAVKLTVTGDGTGTLDVDTHQTTIDASATTGGMTIQGNFAADVKITAGSGDDKIVAAAEISAKDVIDGGAGEDTLSVTADFSASTGTISNIEVVELANTNAQTIDADDAFAGVTKFVVSGVDGSNGNDTYTINDVMSGVTVTTTQDDSANTVDEDIVVALKTDGTADTGTLILGTATAEAEIDNFTANDLETLAIISNEAGADTNVVDGLSVTDATSVTLTGSGDVTFNAVDMKNATSTFDASAATGNITATFSDAQTQTIKTGSGKDSVKISDAGISAYDVFDFGGGADTLTITDVGAAVTATLNASNLETLIFETASSGSIAMDLSKATSVSKIVIDDAGMTSTVALDFVQSGTTVQFLDIDGTGGDTHTVTGVTGAATVTIEVDAMDGTTNDTIKAVNFATVNFNQASNTLSGASAASAIADLDTGSATTLNISAKDNTLTLDDLSTAALTGLVVSGSTDVTISAGGATTIKTITAATLDAANNAAELVLGTGSAIFARATDAVITGSDGADTISMSVAASTHAANVIDAGANATVTASVKGDMLSLGGSMTGDTVIDLSSTTDQISSLSGVANAAVQKGFESVDASAASMVSTAKFTVTGSSGINHITTDAGADIITAGDGADIITAGAGIDTITTGAGADTIILTGITTAANADNITDFLGDGTGQDVLNFSSAQLTGISAAAGLSTTNTALVTAAISDATATSINNAIDGATGTTSGQQIVLLAGGVTGATLTAAQLEAGLAASDLTGAGYVVLSDSATVARIFYDTDFNSGTDGTGLELVSTIGGTVLAGISLDSGDIIA
jgi:hypothetical protein